MLNDGPTGHVNGFRRTKSRISAYKKSTRTAYQTQLNACKLGDSEPVTIRLSYEVGKILISNPKVKVRRPQFKFYI